MRFLRPTARLLAALVPLAPASLVNLERRAGVMVRGRWVPAEEIRRGLEQIAARNAAP